MSNKLKKKHIPNIKSHYIRGFLSMNRFWLREKNEPFQIVCDTHWNSSEIYRNQWIYLHKMGDNAKHPSTLQFTKQPEKRRAKWKKSHTNI